MDRAHFFIEYTRTIFFPSLLSFIHDKIFNKLHFSYSFFYIFICRNIKCQNQLFDYIFNQKFEYFFNANDSKMLGIFWIFLLESSISQNFDQTDFFYKPSSTIVSFVTKSPQLWSFQWIHYRSVLIDSSWVGIHARGRDNKFHSKNNQWNF